LNAEQDKVLSSLLVLAQNGDKDAYNSFLNEISRILRSYLLSRMKETDIVDDIVQDTLISIHKARQTYLPERPLGPWLYAICNHRLVDFYRKFRRVQSYEEQIGFDLFPEISIDIENEIDIEECLLDLPSTQRSVIQLLKVEGHSVKEVALKMGISESNVKVTAFRGYENIRRKMGVKKI
jgi:RNA polymerase sigma-70 factor (ECF subfamily)